MSLYVSAVTGKENNRDGEKETMVIAHISQ